MVLLFIVVPILWGSVFGPCFNAVLCDLCNYIDGEVRASCVYFNCIHGLLCFYCAVALPHCNVGWYAACESVIS